MHGFLTLAIYMNLNILMNFEYIINKFKYIIVKMERKLIAASSLLIEYYEGV